ncbi:MAG: site-2 protease family protein, partial [Deltaproteobacteria bacterium]|nr:site-2 protease family protein [Deltaproteobacteria bacterium]
MSIFTGIFYFIILAGILVFIHEGGHFLAAKLFKVRVLTFSLGMGPKIFGFKKGDTDYIISAIPVGGYVKLFGDDPSEELSNEEISLSMQGISPYKKAIIYIAGPAMNLIFPVFLYFFMFLNQNMVPPAEIGMIIENSPAQKADLQPGDIVTKVNGSAVYSWNHMVEKISSMPGKKIELQINREGKTVTTFVTPKTIDGMKYDIPILSHLKDKKGQIGIVGVYANTIVGIEYNSPAYKNGLSNF